MLCVFTLLSHLNGGTTLICFVQISWLLNYGSRTKDELEKNFFVIFFFSTIVQERCKRNVCHGISLKNVRTWLFHLKERPKK